MNSLKGFRILVVEDTENWQNHIGQVLADYDVTIAGNEADAMRELLLKRDTLFHVAIVDKRLRGDERDDESGLELAKKIKNVAPDCQIIMLTGYPDVNSSREAFKEAGVFDFLVKFPQGGFDNQRLRSTVAEAILQAPCISKSAEVRLMENTESESVTILHLSDLHCGPQHRFSRAHHNTRMPCDDIPRLSSMIARDLQEQDIAPNAITISGDLTHSGDMKEFTWALNIIEDLASKLSIPRKNVIVVPGNHDIEWLEDDTQLLPAHISSNNYRSFYKLFYQKEPLNGNRLFHIASIERKHLVIAGFDSCVIEGSETAGIGYVGSRQLNGICDRIREYPDCIKVAVLHHHLVPVEPIKNLPSQEKQFSLVMDASAVLRKLYQEGFTLVLHGHQHQPYCSEVKLHQPRIDRTDPMVIVGAGSIGVRRSGTGSISRNHYNIAEIKTRGRKTRIRIIGRISSGESAEEFEQYNFTKIDLSPD